MSQSDPAWVNDQWSMIDQNVVLIQRGRSSDRDCKTTKVAGVTKLEQNEEVLGFTVQICPVYKITTMLSYLAVIPVCCLSWPRVNSLSLSPPLTAPHRWLTDWLATTGALCEPVPLYRATRHYTLTSTPDWYRDRHHYPVVSRRAELLILPLHPPPVSGWAQ